MDIVEQMRSLESDHEPDGWPAVTMGQISALCDKVDRLNSVLNGMASEVERLQSLLEQERKESLTASCRVAALEMELDSATSIIEAANAQEPVDYERLLNGEWVKCSKTRYEVTSDPVRALYARPIPAQQSQVSGEYENALKDLQEYLDYESISAEDRNMLSRVIHVMESVQQSPRITEQDAIEVIEDYVHWQQNDAFRDSSPQQWCKEESGRELLTKLNEAKHD